MDEELTYEEPSKELAIGSITITLINEMIQQINDQLCVTFTNEGNTMDEILSAFESCEELTYSDQTYTGYTIVKKFEMSIDNMDQQIYQITLEQPPEDPLTDDQTVAIQYAADNMPDEVALNCRSIFDNWEDLAEGEKIPEGKRLSYNEGLWKCKKSHNKQSDWYPGAEGTLFEQLDAEEHEGTIEDPIPVPESVTTSGFTYVYGKYYSWNGATYLCKRGGIPNPEEMYGQEVELTYAPDALIDQYFVTVTV